MTEVGRENSPRPTERIIEEIANLVRMAKFAHNEIIKQTGGRSGILSEQALESSLASPFATFEAKDIRESTFEKAAILMRSLVKNHPFVDGNKRTSFIMTSLFLFEHGWGLKDELEEDDIVDFCVAVAKNNMPLDEIEGWLRENSSKASAKDFLRAYGFSANKAA